MASPEGKKVREKVEKAAQSARIAGHQFLRDAQPHLLAALRQVHAELQKMISQLEQETSSAEATPHDK